MKKILLVIVLSIVIIGIAVASDLLAGNSAIDLSRADKTTLATKGVTAPTISAL